MYIVYIFLILQKINNYAGGHYNFKSALIQQYHVIADSLYTNPSPYPNDNLLKVLKYRYK
jgi:hypothetical protein